MWTYENPVSVYFGTGQVEKLPELIGSRSYALVTYADPYFLGLAKQLASVHHPPLLTISDVAPNPDYVALDRQAAAFNCLPTDPEVIVAIGGGSVMDSAKVFAASGGDFGKVARFLENGRAEQALSEIPIIAVPTTAGTGSEVTCWATVWNTDTGKKYSLARPALYPEAALVDPGLMIGKSRALTLSTGLDALSHALESLWNLNANPVSASLAVGAARRCLATLPRLMQSLDNIELRSDMAEASLQAGLAFSNTKTAIAHNLSYPITLRAGIPHGIACSFTLPAVLRSVAHIDGFRGNALREIFGDDLERGADSLATIMNDLGVSTRFSAHGVPPEQQLGLIEDAFAGERGKNFIGTQRQFIEAVGQTDLLS